MAEPLALTLRRLDEEDEAERARTNVATLTGQNPDEAAAERAAPARRRDMEILAQSPRLRRYFSSASNAAIAHDDLPSLSLVERLSDIALSFHPLAGRTTRTRRAISDWIDIDGAWEQGQRNIEAARLANRDNPTTIAVARDGFAPLNATERRRLNELDAAPRRRYGIAGQVIEQLPQIAGAFDAGGRRAVRDVRQSWRQIYGDEPRPLNFQNAVAATVLAPVAGVSATISAVGGVGRGIVGFTYEQEAGAAYQEYRGMVDVDGNQISPEIAGEAARNVGMINAGVEFVGLGAAARFVGIKEVVEQLTGGAVRQALRRQGYMWATRRLATGVAGVGLSEGFTELTQEGVTIALGEMARQQQGGEWEDLNPDEVAERAWEAFRTGATVGAVLGGVPAGARFDGDIRAVRDARLQEEVFAALAEGSEASRLKGRSLGAFADAVNTLTANGPLAEVRIDANRFVSFYQDQEIDAHAAADALKGVGADALDRALETGGEISIPMGTYQAQIVGTPSYDGLTPHIRLGPDKLTPAEVRARLELGVDIERATAEATRMQGEANVLRRRVEAVETRISAQFDESGFIPQAQRAFVKTYAEHIVNMAQRSGADPEAMLDRVGFSLRGPLDARKNDVDAIVDGVIERIESAAADIPRNRFPRDGLGVARPRATAERFSARASDADGTLTTSWGATLNYRAGDMIVGEAQGEARPVRADIFAATYEETTPGEFGKRADAVVGYFVLRAPRTIETLEGPVKAEAGDFVLVGAAGEMWPIKRAKFDDRYQVIGDGQLYQDPPAIHPTALRFGTEEEIAELLDLVSMGADIDEVLSHPIMERVEAHAATLEQTLPLSERDNPDALNDFDYVIDGRSVGFKTMLKDALRVARSYGKVGTDRVATIVIGNFAAGKSTFIKKLAVGTRAAVVDADQVKSYIPFYEDGYNTGATGAESSAIRWKVRDALMRKGENIVIEHVGDNPSSVLKSKADLENDGYTVTVVHVKVERNEATRRAVRRFIETGRYIEPSATRRVVGPDLVTAAFNSLVAKGEIDAYIEVDATPPPRQAVALRAKGAELQNEAIADALYDVRRDAGLGRAREAFNQEVSAPDAGGDRGGQLPREGPSAPAFYSAVERIVETTTTTRAPGTQWWATISKAPGVKKEELEWLGLEDWLRAREGPIAREDVLAFVRENGVRVEETLLGNRLSLNEVAADAEMQRQILPIIEERDRVDAERFSLQAMNTQLQIEKPSNWRQQVRDNESKIALLNSRFNASVDRIVSLQGITRRGSGSRWSQYTLPGGENYRELLLRLPEKTNGLTVAQRADLEAEQERLYREKSVALEAGDRAHVEEVSARLGQIELALEQNEVGASNNLMYRSSHYDQPNILAHVRFKERVDHEGRRTLFIEEVQSDWHQAGRERGYKASTLPDGWTVREPGEQPSAGTDFVVFSDKGEMAATGATREQAIATALDQLNALQRVPDAPFKNNAWAALAMKRMIRWAAENGFDQIAWTPGRVQIERFNLSEAVGQLYANKISDDRYLVQLRNVRARDTLSRNGLGEAHRADQEIIFMTPAQMREAFGSEVSKTIIARTEDGRGIRMEGNDLRVGGEGMRAFYDRILVNIANDLGKKYGTRVGETQIDVMPPERRAAQGGRNETVHSLPITPEMGEAALSGVPLFQAGPNQGPRGSATFERNRLGVMTSAVMDLFEARNLSTPIHEFGHIFLETLRMVASDEGASTQTKKDWATALEWMGLTEEQWSTMSMLPPQEATNALRVYHEKFARGFEAYVREGKAPSMALRDVFAQFKRWLISIYKSSTELRVELTPQIREVFDRLLASDKAIADAQAAAGADKPMSRDHFGGKGKAADAAYARYLKYFERAHAEAAEEIDKAAIGALMADRTRWWRSRERKARRAEEINFDSRPEQRAYQMLAFNVWKHGKPPAGLGPIRLSPASLIEDYGQDFINRLPKGLVTPDVDGLVEQARLVRSELNKPAPKRLAEAISDLGGIKLVDAEGRGDIKAIIGTDFAVPVRGGMKRKLLSGTGRTLEGNGDDAGLIMALWEAGYFGAGPDSAGVFQLAGVNAATANMDLLAIARQLEREGKSKGLIWNLTGWSRSLLHNDWQFEIDPDSVKVLANLATLGRSENILKLDEVLDWPELYRAYPWLAEITVYFQKASPRVTQGGSYLASAFNGLGAIWVTHPGGQGSSATMLSVLRHEIQHAIQKHENWPQGYSWDLVRKGSPRWERAWKDRLERQAFWRKAVRGDATPTETDIQKAKDGAAFDVYMLEQGEVEARTVQGRAAESRETRRLNPPGSALDPEYIARTWREKVRRGSGFDQGERPTIDEFKQLLRRDLSGDHVYRLEDQERVEALEAATRMRDWFAERGVDIKAKAGELKKQIEAMAASVDDDGVDADLAASIFGFDSGREMLEAIIDMPDRTATIDAKAREAMLAEYGDPFADGSIAEEARLAAHGAARAQVIEMELDALSRATGGAVRPLARLAKRIAEEQIGRMTVKQIRDYDWFLGNERRHGKEALEALARGNTQEAQMAKHRQLVNHYLYALARKASEETDVAQRYFRKFNRAGVRGNIDGEYLDQIDQLLEQYELRKISGAEIQRRINLTAWVASMEDRGLGHMVNVDPAMLENARKIPFVQLQLDDLRGLVDTVRNIEHLGRLKDKLLEAADRRAFRDVVADLADTMQTTGPISPDIRSNYSPNAVERTQDRMREAHAEMTRMEFLFRYLDGKANGPLWRTLWLPFARAADKESAMMNASAQKMTAIWDRYTPRERARMFKTRIPMTDLPVGAATSYTKAELLSIALNLGNDGNVRALIDGFSWAKQAQQRGAEIDYVAVKDQIIASLNRQLNERDWQTVQQIWDLIGEFRDEAFQLQEDLTGVRPEAVKAEPVQTPYGEIAGGYYPLKFDRARDLRVAKADAAQEVQERWGSNHFKPMTRKGHTINRVGSGGRPVKLSLTVVSEHVQNVVHDIAYRRAVIDVDRLISDTQFAETFTSVAGLPMYEQLRPWLQAIASDRVDPSAFMWKFLQKLRGNVAIAAMGYRISTGLQQITGLVQAIPMLGSVEMGAALVKLVGRPDQITAKSRFILNRSEFMRSRIETFDRDVRETIDRMERSDPLHPIRHHAFALVGVFDWGVSSVVWTAAYDKARAGNVVGIQATDEQAAVFYADSAVRTTQSAGLPQDLPAIMRTQQVNKLLTMFFSYFSVLYNWTAYDQVMGARKGRISPVAFMTNMALIYIVSPMIAETLAGRLAPREDEDEEERNARLISVVARFPFQTVPVLRDIANAVGTGFEYQLSPAQNAPGQIANALQDVAAGRTFESEATTKRFVTAIGYAYGLPTPQAWVTIDYIADKLEGEEEGFDPYEAFVRDTR